MVTGVQQEKAGTSVDTGMRLPGPVHSGPIYTRNNIHAEVRRRVTGRTNASVPCEANRRVICPQEPPIPNSRRALLSSQSPLAVVPSFHS